MIQLLLCYLTSQLINCKPVKTSFIKNTDKGNQNVDKGYEYDIYRYIINNNNTFYLKNIVVPNKATMSFEDYQIQLYGITIDFNIEFKWRKKKIKGNLLEVLIIDGNDQDQFFPALEKERVPIFFKIFSFGSIKYYIMNEIEDFKITEILTTTTTNEAANVLEYGINKYYGDEYSIKPIYSKRETEIYKKLLGNKLMLKKKKYYNYSGGKYNIFYPNLNYTYPKYASPLNAFDKKINNYYINENNTGFIMSPIYQRKKFIYDQQRGLNKFYFDNHFNITPTPVIQSLADRGANIHINPFIINKFSTTFTDCADLSSFEINEQKIKITSSNQDSKFDPVRVICYGFNQHNFDMKEYQRESKKKSVVPYPAVDDQELWTFISDNKIAPFPKRGYSQVIDFNKTGVFYQSYLFLFSSNNEKFTIGNFEFIQTKKKIGTIAEIYNKVKIMDLHCLLFPFKIIRILKPFNIRPISMEFLKIFNIRNLNTKNINKKLKQMNDVDRYLFEKMVDEIVSQENVLLGLKKDLIFSNKRRKKPKTKTINPKTKIKGEILCTFESLYLDFLHAMKNNTSRKEYWRERRKIFLINDTHLEILNKYNVEYEIVDISNASKVEKAIYKNINELSNIMKEYQNRFQKGIYIKRETMDREKLNVNKFLKEWSEIPEKEMPCYCTQTSCNTNDECINCGCFSLSGQDYGIKSKNVLKNLNIYDYGVNTEKVKKESEFRSKIEDFLISPIENKKCDTQKKVDILFVSKDESIPRSEYVFLLRDHFNFDYDQISDIFNGALKGKPLSIKNSVCKEEAIEYKKFLKTINIEVKLENAKS